MGNNDVTVWRIKKVDQFEEIHENSLDLCFYLRQAAGTKIELQGSDIEKRTHFYNWFYQGLLSIKDYHLKDDKYFVGPWTDYDHSRVDYGVVIGGMCLLGATWVKEMKKDTIDFREDIEFYIDYLQRLFGVCLGYHLAILDMKVKKRGSGQGQKDALERRIKAISDVLLPRSKDGIVSIDRGDFFQMVNNQFKGLERYPRDPKTYKTYKEGIEAKNKIKIILEKGTFIPE